MGAAIEIDRVSKHFRLNHARADSLKERVVNFRRASHEEFWALRDVSIEVAAGQTVGLLGHNGSGKSTLLKCVAGILRPTSGSIVKHGRTAALLELGAGFHGDLTGRENVYMNASILGFSRAEIDRIFDDIVAFSEIEPFIDNQVKHYSSGMAARLGFAVAVNVEPEILLVDEVLSVGDEAFQQKCLDRIARFQQEGRTILLVSHAVDMVRRICSRVAVLDHGELIAFDEPDAAARAFREHLYNQGGPVPNNLVDPRELATRAVRMTDVRVVYADPARGTAAPSEPLEVRVDYVVPEPLEDVVFAMTVFDRDHRVLMSTNTHLNGDEISTLAGSGTCVFRFERFPVTKGTYMLSIGVHSLDGRDVYDQRAEQDYVEVAGGGHEVGPVHFPLRVELQAR